MSINRSNECTNLLSQSEDVYENKSELLIMKTDIERRSDFRKIRKVLLAIPGVVDATIDLGDCDRVLRVEYEGTCVCKVRSILEKSGFSCAELED
jgi:hypothetical protein